MTQAAATNHTELEARLIARAWQDEAFKQQLLKDPRAVIAAETGGGDASRRGRHLRVSSQPGAHFPAIAPSPNGRIRCEINAKLTPQERGLNGGAVECL